MLEFFLELFSEEIPARMQRDAAAELKKLIAPVLAELKATAIKTYYGPRRIAIRATVAAEKPGSVLEARGPRDSAPEAALAGFLGKHSANRDEVIAEGGYFVLRRNLPALSAAELLAVELPGALAKFSWPKSMRWGTSGEFTWVRPLRRIVCLLDGAVLPVTLGPVTASSETEGHRVHGPNTLDVSSAAVWEEKLREHYVVVDQDERRARIADGIARGAAALSLSVARDDGLLDEVTALVERPNVLIGRFDEAFLEVPQECLILTMKANQKYFPLLDGNGKLTNKFLIVSNIRPEDPSLVVSGNERVVRPRLSDAKFFFDQDRKKTLASRVESLGKIVYHNKLGSLGERIERIWTIAQAIGLALGGESLSTKAAEAAMLSKADLVTDMVGEFPELQGIMGRYYALHDGHSPEIAFAIEDHYRPRFSGDDLPRNEAGIAVALADKLEALYGLFSIGQTPTGDKDPYALRRQALGVVRILMENGITVGLDEMLSMAANAFPDPKF
ncbi:MAG: glycine--tRNA ligase subunit beta, partial [Acidocella sp. 20-63-7]